MKNLKRLMLCIFCALCGMTANAQTPSDLLKIMVVPYIKSGERISTKIDTSEIYRVAINAMHNLLENKGYTVMDFMEWLEVLKSSGGNVVRDPETQRILNAPADVYIYIELLFKEFPNGEKQLNLQLFANDKYSADRYATSMLISSTKRFWPDYIAPMNNPSEVFNPDAEAGNFLKKLDTKLKDVLENGRMIRVKIVKKAACKIALDQPVSGTTETPFGQIAKWVKERAFKQSAFHGDGNANLLVINFKAPLLSFSPYEFGNDLAQFINNINTLPAKPKAHAQVLRSEIVVNIE